MLLLPTLIVAIAIALRVLKGKFLFLEPLANFSPFLVLPLLGAALFPKKVALWLPMFALLLCDILVRGATFWQPLPLTLCFYSFAFTMLAYGKRVKSSRSTYFYLGSVWVGTVLYFLLSNTAAFFISPVYAKTAAGWLQCLTTGTPGYPPTWWFLVKSLMGNTLFTLLVTSLYRLSWSDLKAEPVFARVEGVATKKLS